MLKNVQRRTIVIAAIIAILFLVVMIRIAWLQIVNADEMMQKAQEMWDADSVIPAQRGAIYDRNGNVLAYDGRAYTIAVNPRDIQKKDAAGLVVKKLAPVLAISEEKLRTFVTKQKPDGRYYAQVEVRNEGWKVNKKKANQVRKVITELRLALKDNYFNGVLILDDSRRYYPLERLASHVLGYYDKTGQAIGGVERQFDSYLRGSEGKIEYKRFAENRIHNGGNVVYVPAQNGKSIQLTIDVNIQHFIEEAMDEIYKKFKPKSMATIAVDPQTMEILGLSNRPNFNPNEYWNFESQSDFYNFALGATYEPGSTFKIVTLAGAIEEKMFNPAEMFLSGGIKVGGHTIHDHNYVGWGNISYLEGLLRSSNVAFVKLGYERLGTQRLKNYIHKFGFGKKTNIDLAGEASGLIALEHPSDYAAATFGQGRVTVTALQQVAAVASIANGGKLLKPYIMKQVSDENQDKVLKTMKPEMINRTISEHTSKEVTKYLEQVISNQEMGTGRKAYIEGYRMAGKTGTANKVVNGAYASNQWVLSLIGYAPVDHPRILLCTIVDAPNLGGDYRRGGEVNAPMFKQIMFKSLQYFGEPFESVQQAPVKEELMTTVPEMTSLSVMKARETAKRFQLTAVVLGNGEQVLQQSPKYGEEVLHGEDVYLLTQSMDNITFPDMKGKSLRDVIQLCNVLNKECDIDGSGYVVSQQEAKLKGKAIMQFSLQTASDRLRKVAQSTSEQQESSP